MSVQCNFDIVLDLVKLQWRSGLSYVVNKCEFCSLLSDVLSFAKQPHACLSWRIRWPATVVVRVYC